MEKTFLLYLPPVIRPRDTYQDRGICDTVSVDNSFGEYDHSIYKRLNPHILSPLTSTDRNLASNHSSCFTDHFWQTPPSTKRN